MAKVNTSSIRFPNMFAVSQNKVGLVADEASITNRVKLLIQTEPTEVYNTPHQGVGLKKHMFKYNSDNVKAIIRDEIVEQLRQFEPCVEPDKTEWISGLIATGKTDEETLQARNTLEMSILLHTKYDTTATVTINVRNE